MAVSFDIAEDELQVFLAEADEQLQMLDEGLVRLEREGDDSELLQSIFRAAHTLKGSAGAIGHHRMADLTHAMESALDGLRKGTLAISAPLVDALRILLNEVTEGEASAVDTSPLVGHLSRLATPASPAAPAPTPSPVCRPDAPRRRSALRRGARPPGLRGRPGRLPLQLRRSALAAGLAQLDRHACPRLRIPGRHARGGGAR